MAGPLHIRLIPTIAPYLLPHIISGTAPAVAEARDVSAHEAQTHQLLAQLDSGNSTARFWRG